jgi:uncharacterized protein
MSKESLPHKLDPYRFAENAISVHGKLPINQLTRLTPALEDTTGDVDVTLDFGIDEQGIHYMRGHYKAQLSLQCQRCMGSFFYGIIGDFLSGIVGTEEEAEKLPDRYDPVITEEGMLVVSNIIEDELIVSLPIVPMHKEQECTIKLPSDTDLNATEPKRESPFKVIELLRDKRNR